MYIAQYSKHVLQFKTPSGTSRGILYERPIWLLKVNFLSNPNIFGIGECSPIEGLSIDPIQEMDPKLAELVGSINEPSDKWTLLTFRAYNSDLKWLSRI